MDFEIFAYPYPGRSAKISAGLTFIFSPAPSCSEKKLIARVRPGVEETFASREPSSELINEDLPTFERPRNATSGAPYVFASEGKCATSVADNKKTGFSRIDPVYRQHLCSLQIHHRMLLPQRKKHLPRNRRGRCPVQHCCGSYCGGGT